jgi:acetylornithine deacetylase
MHAEVTDLISDLVAIDSVNPALVPGGAGEGEIASFIVDWGRAAGLEVKVLDNNRKRPTVVLRCPGRGNGPNLLLCGHTDTIGVEGMVGAHVPRIVGDRLFGRGAYDMKAGVAAALLACRECAKLELSGDVLVAAVADEEHESLGVREALRAVAADFAIVTEPTELAIGIAHQGFVWFQIEVTGRAAHGSRPDLGVDAIVKAAPILTQLGALDESRAGAVHPLLGGGSVHASLIRGGLNMATYPNSCVVSIERRTLPRETVEDVEQELSNLLADCRRADRDLVVELRRLTAREGFEVSADAPVVAAVRAAATGVLGAPPPTIGASYWSDAAFTAGAGIPTVLFGPGGEGAHAIEEWVSIRDTMACARILQDVAEALCG